MSDSAVHMKSQGLPDDTHRSNAFLNHSPSSKVYISPALRLKQEPSNSVQHPRNDNVHADTEYGEQSRKKNFNEPSGPGYPQYPSDSSFHNYENRMSKTHNPYRPPQLRMKQEEENNGQHSYYRGGMNMSHHAATGMGDRRMRMNASNASYGSSSQYRGGGGTSYNSAVNDRSTFFMNGSTGKYIPSSRSVTKTGWDVRGGRRYYQDIESEVFSANKVHTGINFDSYDDIPVEMTGQGADKIEVIENFQSTEGVHELLMKNVKRVNYTRPTPVQKNAIPVILNGRDLMACAQTGSGKTAAFLFPVISCMLKLGPPVYHNEHNFMARKDPALPVCLVLSPTRELAVQIFQEARKFSFGTGIRTSVVYGGSDVRAQMADLDKGCDICVATPGRLKDLMDRKKVKLACVRHLVLDEADRMLDMGFLPQMRDIVLESDMPHSTEGRQTVMFSATFPREVQQLAREFLRNYIFLSVGRVGSTNNFILQRLQYATDQQKLAFLIKILRETESGLTLIFVETKRKADQIEGSLVAEDFHAVSIHGDRSQAEREEALRLFKDGRWPILVATDVAARGLDIPNITHVINFDIPNNIDDYVHRIGRTGRAGNKGLATSFVNESNWPVFRDLLSILTESNQEIPHWFHLLMMETTSAGRLSGNRGNRGNGNASNNFANHHRGGGGNSSNSNRFSGFRDIRGNNDVATYNHGRSSGKNMGGVGSHGSGHRMGAHSDRVTHGFESDMNYGFREDAW